MALWAYHFDAAVADVLDGRTSERRTAADERPGGRVERKKPSPLTRWAVIAGCAVTLVAGASARTPEAEENGLATLQPSGSAADDQLSSGPQRRHLPIPGPAAND